MRSYSKHKALQGFLLQKLHESVDVIIKNWFYGLSLCQDIVVVNQKIGYLNCFIRGQWNQSFALKIWISNSCQCCQKVVVSVVYMFV